MKIGIFCSANNNIDPEFFKMTEELGLWMGKNGHSLVFGGCNMGLMETIGRSVKTGGGLVYGVVPRIVEQGGKLFSDLDVHIPCDNLSDRKDIMLSHSDIIIALPGGIGTLDEVFTVAAGSTIGYHHKKVIMYNMKGFWNQFVTMLDDLQVRGFIRGDYHNMIKVATNLDEISDFLDNEKD